MFKLMKKNRFNDLKKTDESTWTVTIILVSRSTIRAHWYHVTVLCFVCFSHHNMLVEMLLVVSTLCLGSRHKKNVSIRNKRGRNTIGRRLKGSKSNKICHNLTIVLYTLFIPTSWVAPLNKRLGKSSRTS